jgi:hypothetical protein
LHSYITISQSDDAALISWYHSFESFSMDLCRRPHPVYRIVLDIKIDY